MFKQFERERTKRRSCEEPSCLSPRLFAALPLFSELKLRNIRQAMQAIFKLLQETIGDGEVCIDCVWKEIYNYLVLGVAISNDERPGLTYVWAIQVSSEAVDVLLLSQHNPAVFVFVCDIQHWNLDNEVKSNPCRDIYRTVLCDNLV